MESISQDSKINSEIGTSYYVAEASIDIGSLVDDSQNEIELKLGMECTAEIITGKKKLLYYLLEKFDLINN